jgi:hypothetical protein
MPAKPSATAKAPPIGICTAIAAPVFWLLKPLASAVVCVEVALASVPVGAVLVVAVAAAAEALLMADLADAMEALLNLSLLSTLEFFYLGL